MRQRTLVTLILLSLPPMPVQAVTIETVPVGNSNNAADPVPADPMKTCCYGSVAENYRIGVYEITNAQYAEFLNAVAATDTHELFHPLMHEFVRGGILRSGVEGSYQYTPKEHFADKPVNYISFWDAARFVNWMHNGQPTGAQDASTTEEGAYNLGGETFPLNRSVTRQPGARWFLPSEDQWYKAAYYDPRRAADGGPPNDDHYWGYATQSDDPPIPATSDRFGNVDNPGPNVANYLLSVVWNRAKGNVSTVGSAGAPSFYGTYDQAGNLWEWNEEIIQQPTWNFSYRGNRGGNWDDTLDKLMAEYRSYAGIELCGIRFQCFNGSQGFRVARHFSPIDLNGDDIVDALDIDLLSEQARLGTLNTAYDLNGDGIVDLEDRRFWIDELANTYIGDANLDGVFDSNDLVAVFVLGQYEVDAPMNSSWASGDWNGDLKFDSGDLLDALATGGYENGPRGQTVSVPEPQTIPLAWWAVLLLLYRVRT
jgi:formylglycine-generating enzyme